MSKTLQDLSNKYGAKKPALYARLKKIRAGHPETELFYKKANVLYLTDIGLELLEADLKVNPINTKVKQKKQDKQPQLKTENNRELIESQKAYIKTLEQQLEAKDKTIDKLLSVIENLNSNYSQSLSESHSLTSQQQTIKAFELSQPEITASNKTKRLMSKLIITGKLFRGDYD